MIALHVCICALLLYRKRRTKHEDVFESFTRDREWPSACALLIFPTAVPCPGVGLGTLRYPIDTIARGPLASVSPTQSHADKTTQRFHFCSSVLYFISGQDIGYMQGKLQPRSTRRLNREGRNMDEIFIFRPDFPLCAATRTEQSSSKFARCCPSLCKYS